ncbi:hypothetical protein [Polynucleobacter sp. JS-JIR-5-A7]|uniref:hypothetical protein n=1 Tax=Polynucleobacter sp. JS-JIR-5-A7 TaxID=1758395 RepID=UPI001BFCDF91|nr:hypothetical protein [Polynucleobacter sp. JS-JIR-5-A7]QWE06921.1 hypothetical protein AOC29_01585 [Polynucleobacter sp. JS-JIR-5-A7]
MAFNKLSKDPMRFIGKLLKYFDKNKSAYRTQFEEEYLFSIANTRFVGSYPLMARCNISPKDPQSSSVDHEYLAKIPERIKAYPRESDPISIYICTDALPKFVTEVLKHIQLPFVLVTGDSDISINRSYLGENFDRIIENPFLDTWFAQNKAIDSPKLQSLPIGIDFHSKWVDPQIWGGGLILPALQELELRKIFSESLPWSEREPKAYCDWIFSLDRGDRSLCKEHVDLSACIFPQANLSRTMAWQAQSNYAFVISPSGAGTDCHRTWEALALGCIPIVKRHHLSDLFVDLPVIVVDEWKIVTQDFLIGQHANLKDRAFDYSGLFLSYWADRIGLKNSPAHQASKMTMDQYRHLITQ